MSENIKISVILPIYNVEKYLSQCLDSIIVQTYKNLEIICVNDGSTDNSLEIINQYAQKDNRIIVISQENKGQGEARNQGLKIATGEYVSFIDPDDWIISDAYEFIANKIKELKSDVLQFEYGQYIEATDEYKQSSIERRFNKNFKIDIANKDYYSFSDFDKKDFLKFKASCWDKVYKREFLHKNSLNFLPHKSGEDTVFNLKLLLCVDKIYFVHKVLYYYRKRSYSVVNKNNKSDSRYIFEQIDYIKKILVEHNLYNEMRKEFFNYKIRAIYEGDKECDDEYKEDFINIAKNKMTFKEYVYFVCKKNISKILRTLFSIEKNVYTGCTKNIIVTILGIKILIKCK